MSDTSQQAIEAIQGRFEHAWNEHDMDAFAALFAEDADFVNVFGMRWRGRAAIRQAHVATHATVFRDSHLAMQAPTVRLLAPEVAVCRSSWTLQGHVDPAGQPQAPRHGVMTHVLQRQAGDWLIVFSQNTDSVPMP